LFEPEFIWFDHPAKKQKQVLRCAKDDKVRTTTVRTKATATAKAGPPLREGWQGKSNNGKNKSNCNGKSRSSAARRMTSETVAAKTSPPQREG
jgi:hypothetical protein